MNNRMAFNKLAFLAVPLAMTLFHTQALAESFGGLQSDGPQSLQIAQGQSPAGPGKPEAGANQRPRLLEQVGLSPEQRQKVQAIREQGRAQSEALRQQLETKQQAMMRYLQSSNADEAQARTLNADINRLQQQLSEARLKTWFSIRQQLTPEQLEKLKALKAKRGAGHPGASHPRPKGGGPQGGEY